MHRLVFLLSFAVTAGLPLAQTPVPNAQRPNVVLIITDDVGYGDFGTDYDFVSRLMVGHWPGRDFYSVFPPAWAYLLVLFMRRGGILGKRLT